MVHGVKSEAKYVLGLPEGTQIDLGHGKKLPKDYDHQPRGGVDRGQRFNGFFCEGFPKHP